MIEAGFNSSSAFDAKRVSPRVTDATMTPQIPPRVCARRIDARSVDRAIVVRGDVQAGPTGTVERAVRTGVRLAAVRRRDVWRRWMAFAASGPTARMDDGARSLEPCAPTDPAAARTHKQA